MNLLIRPSFTAVGAMAEGISILAEVGIRGTSLGGAPCFMPKVWLC
tara:strand:+ start:160 stop:297 length:138 start_codon:yes stop_codon:yes gene_type:complete